MSKSKQTTLFQSWSGPKRAEDQHSDSKRVSRNTNNDEVIICDDDEDEELLRALELSLRESQHGLDNEKPSSACSSNTARPFLFSSVGNKVNNKNVSEQRSIANDSNAPGTSEEGRSHCAKTRKPSDLGLFKPSGTKQGVLSKYSESNPQGHIHIVEEEPQTLTEDELLALDDLPGFDKFMGQKWIYPTNYPMRDYQFNIVKASLFANTIVVLPTGLGKTFVAAVVMYNFYRWYPQGKVIFMAPTKPLVAQQIEACYNIMGIPQSATAEMTGAMQPTERKREWQDRRIFFLTPQVLMNDLSRGACPALMVKCLVVDEAHKALGNHAYCQVVRELAKYEGEFRVLALSATPGSDMKAVQQVISNLLISHVELRGDESPDIKPYTHERKVEKIVVKLGEELNAVKVKYTRLMEMVVNRLKRYGVLYNREVTSLSKFLVLKARDAFRQNPPHNLPRPQYGVIEGDFALAMSLYHGYDLLLLHGLRSLYSFLLGIVNGEKGYGRTRTELQRSGDFTDLMESLEKDYNPVKGADPNMPMTQSASQLAAPFAIGHPKMGKLQDVVVEHFNAFKAKGDQTRIMIFSQYRDSVSEITEMLNRHRPLVKVMSFIGQSSAGKVTKGFTQKEQLRVMREFREGGFNTLVSTCVGEEGLDIGDVDLIICFDAHKSPIRLVQRMGRTGRKREGRIIMLVTEGKEESIYNQSQYSKRSIHKAIENGARSLIFYANSKRMVPEGLKPYCHKMHITVHQEYKAGNKRTDSTAKKAPVGKRTAVKKKAASKDGFLTEDELKHWSEHYKVKDCEVPRLHTSRFVTLKNAMNVDPEEDKEQPREKTLSLNAWMPWQNRLHDTLLVSHSEKTRMLVDLLEFMDVQGAVGEEEDVYGQEMQLYLNKADVNFKSKSTIDRFCQPSVDSNNLKRKREDQPEPKKRIRRSEKLPGFSSDEDNFGGSDGDDDLPAFDGKNAKFKRNTKDKHSSGSDGTIENKGRDLHSIVVVSDEDNGKGSSDGEEQHYGDSLLPNLETKMKTSTGKGKGKGKGLSNKTKTGGVVEGAMNKFSEPTLSRKTKRKKKRSCDINNQSVIALIDNRDDDDFESSQHPYLEPPPNAKSEVGPGRYLTFQDKDSMLSKAETENHDSEDDRPGNDLPESNENADDPATIRHSPRMTLDFMEPLPIFSSQNVSYRIDADAESDISLQVPSPPTRDELSQTLNQLELKERLSPVDILNLIDTWDKEKKDHSILSDFTPAVQGKCSVAQEPVRLLKNIPTFGDQDEDIPDEAFSDFFFDDSGVISQGFNVTSPGFQLGKKKDPNENLINKNEDKTHDKAATQLASDTKSESVPQFDLLCSDILDTDSEPFHMDVSHTSPDKEDADDLSTGSVSPVFPSSIRVLQSKNTSTPLIGKSSIIFRPDRKSNVIHSPIRIDAVVTDKPCAEDMEVSLINKEKVSAVEKRSEILEIQKSAYESFFANETDDDLFADIETPQPVQSKRRSPLLPKPSEMGTSMTFTQALNCVDESFNISKSFVNPHRTSSSSEDSPYSGYDKEQRSRHSPVLGKPEENNTKAQIPKENNSDREIKKDTPPLEKIISPEMKSHSYNDDKSPQLKPSKPISDAGQFDLGFDFDEFDDEMIIPPSPAKEIISQSQSRSRTLFASRRLNLSVCSQQNQSQGISSQSTQPFSRSIRPIPEGQMEDEENPEADASIKDEDEDSQSLIGHRLTINAPAGMEISMRSKEKSTLERKPSTPILVVRPYVNEEFSLVDDGIKPISDPFADDEDSDELFKNLDPDVPFSSDVMPHEESQSDDDDSFIISRPRRKKPGPLILSQNTPDKTTPFKTPTKPAPKAHKPAKMADLETVDEDSPILPPKRSRRPQRVEFDDSPVSVRRGALKKSKVDTVDSSCLDDFDDDFKDYPVRGKTGRTIADRERDVPRKPKSKQKSSAAAGFLDLEAERSEDDDSEDDTEGSDMDDMDDSFINDCSQMTQAEPVHDADMRAIYRQSTRSPTLSGGRYKLAYGLNADMDVFSQMPQQDSEYMEDSFVVHGGEEDDDDLDGFLVNDADEVGSIGSEVSLLDSNFDMTMSRQTRRQARITAIRQENAKGAAKRPTTKSRKRVVQRIDSSSEDEVELPSTQALMGAVTGGSRAASDSSNKTRSSTSDVSTSGDEPLSSSVKRISTKVGAKTSIGTRTGISSWKERHLNTTADDQSQITQLPSLQTRCKLRLNPYLDNRKIIEQMPKPNALITREKKENVPGKRVQVAKKKTVEETVDDGATFSLGTHFLGGDDWDEGWPSDEELLQASPEFKAPTVIKPLSSTLTTNYEQESSIQNVLREPKETSKPSVMSDRERRLKLAREKQAKFKAGSSIRKPAAQDVSETSKFHGTQILPPPPSPAVHDTTSFNMTNNFATPRSSTASNISFVSPIAPPKKCKTLILVDSKEINGAQDIISELRFKHNAQTVVRQLGTCDYILSNRLAVDRLSVPAFSNGAHKARLVARVREMCELYDRPCLIIEAERLKPGVKKPSRPVLPTKYVSGIMAALARTHVKILYSENQGQTATLLSNLATQEQKKGQAIQGGVELSTQQEQAFRFYLSLPKTSYTMALNICHHFRTIADFVKSSVQTLAKRGPMTEARAKEIYAYLRRDFDPQMLSLQR